MFTLFTFVNNSERFDCQDFGIIHSHGEIRNNCQDILQIALFVTELFYFSFHSLILVKSFLISFQRIQNNTIFASENRGSR
jgi:hypothetical protein